jgi:polar amino acid transport system ATP-binding protein
MTMVVVTHEMAFAQRVAELGRGVRPRQGGRAGAARQIFEAPTAERTRDFLGHLGWHG